jgi:hypothetical protein
MESASCRIALTAKVIKDTSLKMKLVPILMMIETASTNRIKNGSSHAWEVRSRTASTTMTAITMTSGISRPTLFCTSSCIAALPPT